jgi:potassium channel subfamily T protein 1
VFSLKIGIPYHPIGCSPTKCKLLKSPEKICCLQLHGSCEHVHSKYKDWLETPNEYKWNYKCIILAAEQATNGLFNFILPLRSKARSTARLKPIILLLKNE